MVYVFDGHSNAGLEQMLSLILVIGLVTHVFYAFALWSLSKKMNTGTAWFAIIPITNVYLMVELGGFDIIMFLGLIATNFIPVVGTLISIVFLAIVWRSISQKLGKPGWWGILCALPIINFYAVGVLAWGKSEKSTTVQNKVVQERKAHRSARK